MRRADPPTEGHKVTWHTEIGDRCLDGLESHGGCGLARCAPDAMRDASLTHDRWVGFALVTQETDTNNLQDLIAMHRHVVVDTNLLADYLHPAAARSPRVADRVRVLFDAVLVAKWTDIKVYVPAIAVAEAISVLDKYRFCRWHGPAKKNPAVRLHTAEYKRAQNLLHQAVTKRQLEQIDHEPCHVVLASLLSPVNHIYQYRRKRAHSHKVRPPMGSADCMIGGAAILLGSRVGFDKTRLLTADQRLADVMTKCRNLTQWRAAGLGLPPIAEGAGLAWAPSMYPITLNLRTAREKDLRAALGGWPLPTTQLRRLEKASAFTELEDHQLVATWVGTASDYGIRNADNMPFHPALQDMRTRLAAHYALDVPNDVIFKRLLALRKRKLLPKTIVA